MVQPCHLQLVNKPGFLFCRSADCDVVIFHPDGDSLRKPDVRMHVGLKETADPVPICYCFGFTEAMAVEEIRNTGKCTIPQRIAAEVKAGTAPANSAIPKAHAAWATSTRLSSGDEGGASGKGGSTRLKSDGGYWLDAAFNRFGASKE